MKSVKWWPFGLVLALTMSTPVVGAEPLERRLIEQHLDAGEFGLAVERAKEMSTGRDRWLGRIAARQARMGASQAASATLRQIRDRNELEYAASSIKPQPEVARGGATMADFDTLINLITETVSPDSWDDVGGPGSIAEFPGGVYVDPAGVLRQVSQSDELSEPELNQLHSRAAARPNDAWAQDPRRPSDLRMISLPRLERELRIRQALGQTPSTVMRHLAGLRKIQYLFVYPDSGDLVIAGPAGDWTTAGATWGGVPSSRPVILLDDLVVLLRNAACEGGRFGCSISPRTENLARTRAFLATSTRPLRPRQTPRWIERIRQHLGLQNIEVHGLDPTCRIARALVEADYHMKLVGMGLAPSVGGIPSYLDLVDAGNTPSSMDVLRWWFTLEPDCLTRNADGDAFALATQSVRLRSENELIGEGGERLQTGAASELNRQFANNFTTHFSALAAKYPLYAQLENVFDLALMAAVIRHEELDQQVGWEMERLLDGDLYQPARGRAPSAVSSIVNHRVVNRRRIVVGVSGGVSVDTRAAMARTRRPRDDHGLGSERDAVLPVDDSLSANWWWD